MPFNGAGVFTRLYTWVNDAASNIKIRADRMDNEMDGFATGLSNCITKDGQTTVTANLPMATFRHTGVGNASSPTDYSSASQVMNSSLTHATSVGGTANAITLSFSISFSALTAGMAVSFIATADNTGAVTVSVDGLTAVSVTKEGADALEAGDIVTGDIVTLVYDGTQFQLTSTIRQDVTKDGNNTFSGDNTFTGTSAFQGAVTNTKTVSFAKGADIASATALTLGNDGNYFDVTGTTTIETIDTVGVGTVIKLHFDDVLTLTHSTDLVLPSGADITTAAGDEAEFIEYATGDWRCVNYSKASGAAIVPTQQSRVLLQTETASASATIDLTGLDSTYDTYEIEFFGVVPQTDGQNLLVRTSADGVTYDSGATDYQYVGSYFNAGSAATNVNQSGGSTSIRLIIDVGNDTGESASGELKIFNPSETSFNKLVNTSTVNIKSNNVITNSELSAQRAATSAVQAIRFFFSSGNIASGTFKLYGVR